MSARELFDEARRMLADAPREALGREVEPRRILGIGRGSRITPVGSVWHLGVLLIGEDDVFATGDILRSHQEVRRGYPAESQRRRAERSAAAFRGGFPEGATVHVGWRMLDLVALERGEASRPLAIVDGEPSVHWSASGGYMPLGRYLDERVALLTDPPHGA
ncbi:glutaminase [Microbacterium sp.]|uniref:glutaminase n=1 Tax=Microbacterium sp. TaxID=51671 RepID=UPI003F6F42DC